MNRQEKLVERMRQSPIEISEWEIAQVGPDNSGPYKDAYPKIPVEGSSEPLVSLRDFGIVSSDYYLDEFLGGRTSLLPAVEGNLLRSAAYVRQTHAVRLQKVDDFLRNAGCFLHVQSGWRHQELQEMIRSQYAKEHGATKANRMFAPVIPNCAPPPHSTGAAFDLEIRNLSDGSRQELYFAVDGKSIHGAPWLELLNQSPDKNLSQILSNRRLLYHVLCTVDIVLNQDEVFTAHPGECWHFGDGDPLSAYLSREPFARYGAASPT